MKYNRDVKTDLFNILSLVSCSDTYGFDDDVFFDAMAGITGMVTDLEIDEFIKEEFEEEGYGEEDREESKENLTDWRDKYCNII